MSGKTSEKAVNILFFKKSQPKSGDLIFFRFSSGKALAN